MAKDSKPSTIKKLFALSGNRCAFPGCMTSLVYPNGKVTGELCHIKARNPNGPRYDFSQTDDERRSFENLILMCPIHHSVIDDDLKSYTVEKLREMKATHEANYSDNVVHQLLTDDQKNNAEQRYVTDIAELILDKGLRKSEPGDDVQFVAWMQTLAVLPSLDGTQKARLLKSLYRMDLINAKETIISLSEADLTSSDLRSVDFRGINLSGANLSRADLRGADLCEANLRRVDLSGSSLRGANLSWANLSNACLRDADLHHSHLPGADLTAADLRGAKIIAVEMPEAKLVFTDLSKSSLMGSELRGSDFRGADLSGADLSGTIVTDEELRGAMSIRGCFCQIDWLLKHKGLTPMLNTAS